MNTQPEFKLEHTPILKWLTDGYEWQFERGLGRLYLEYEYQQLVKPLDNHKNTNVQSDTIYNQ